MKTKLTWALVAIIAFIFGQSLFFKFSGSEETVIIFSTIASWMQSIGLPSPITNYFRDYGGYTIALTELIAIALLFIPRLRVYGAGLSLSVISGAIFFHLFTPLGVDRAIDQHGNTDGGALFIMACIVAISSLLLLIIELKMASRPQLGGHIAAERG